MRYGLRRLGFKVLAAILICMLLPIAVSAEPKVGVIGPELRAPFNVIFDTVSMGIDDGLKKRSSKLILSKDYDSKSIRRWIEKENINAVITLGGVGQRSAVYVPNDIPIVLGALLSSPGPTNKFPGVALTPNPKSLFQLLKQFDNQRNRIVVVYSPTSNQWLIDLAKRQAAEIGVQLVALKATDIKQAAIIYHEIFDGDVEYTSIWLLQDRTVVDSKVVLPYILEKAWQKKMLVFSSALSHVKKGVLFSMYPDNKSHGKQLADLVLKRNAGISSTENMLYPTEGLQSAVNSRTAEHLGLNISRSEMREFNVVFPVSN